MRFSFFRRSASKPYHERLRALPLFQDLNTHELDIVSSLLHEREYLENEVIFDDGEAGHAIYIIITGHVLIFRGSGEARRLVADLLPGTGFGEMALLTNTPRATQARAGSNSKMLVFFRDDFNNLMHTHAVIASKLGINLARHIGLRLREVLLGRNVDQTL
ncbi:MAG TPA: cyclic nucleotide-binding domain-containing protein [Rhodocyclaceae bacterium]|nr:cyclic nucleotide-binding domain-containing protein [Rhodocyclaceae bacterium]